MAPMKLAYQSTAELSYRFWWGWPIATQLAAFALHAVFAYAVATGPDRASTWVPARLEMAIIACAAWLVWLLAWAILALSGAPLHREPRPLAEIVELFSGKVTAWWIASAGH